MTSWIEFQPCGRSKSGLTRVWSIVPKDGSQYIGTVSWYASWRQYCFAPQPNTVFEEDCLREIASFCEARTKEHKAKAKMEKAGAT